MKNIYPNSVRKSNGTSERVVEHSLNLDNDDELHPFPHRKGDISISHRRTTIAEVAPPTQILVNIDESIVPTECLHRSVDDSDSNRGYFDDISDSDTDGEDIVPKSIFSRQYNASNKNSSIPVAPVVLQSLPTIRVRAEDLNCIPCPNTSAMRTRSKQSSDCFICGETVLVHTTAVRLPCSHIYHPKCIDMWLRQHHTCPNCCCPLPTLADFTTPRSILQKRHEEKLVAISRGKDETNYDHELRPIQFNQAELKDMSINDLKAIHTQWVTCTYNQTFMSMRIPDRKSVV